MAAPFAFICFVRRCPSLLFATSGKQQQTFVMTRLMKQHSRVLSTSNGLCQAGPESRKTADLNARSQSNDTPASLNSDSKASAIWTNSHGRLSHLMQMYEDIVGLTEVMQAQEKVVSAERKFLQVQEDRRSMQQELLTVQAEVRAVGAELEKTSRTDSRYIDLVKKEHEILLIEKEMSSKIKSLDKAERDFFALLSAALRESHEKERSRAEKTKYWSIIGSIIGAIIGIVGSTINNMKRMKELRAIVTKSGENTAEYKALANNMLETLVAQHSKLEEFVQSVSQNESLGEARITDPLFVSNKDFNKHTETVLKVLENQSKTLHNHLQEIQQVLSIQKASGSDAGNDSQNVVYVGPELEGMLQRTEQRLQNDLIKNNWKATAVLGGVMTLGISVIIFLMQGSS